MVPGDHDTTRAIASYVEPVSADSWYLIVTDAHTVASRVVQLLDDGEVVFGRSAGVDVAIEHESVSRRHALVFRRSGQVIIEDLGSRNGTLVNGTPVSRPQRLAPGDTIRVGPATAVVATASASRRARQVATVSELDDRFAAEVDRAVRYQRPVALVMLRLEGAPAAVTAHVERLLSQIRRMDLLAEYGADELALVLPETGAEPAALVAERARRGGAGLVVHTGVATYPGDGAHAGELVGIARDRLRGARTSAPRRRKSTIAEAIGREIVVVDPQMKHVFELAKRVAPTPMTVLITGETGAGKEAVADAIHRLSGRSARAYVRLNCAAMTESLVESELFGHEKGAFTGAAAAKAGYFEAASGGTLFLDEVGELPLAMQSKLLRVLEQRKVMRVGSTREIAVDTRVVCATHRNLEADVRRGRFREDLFFRISAFVIPVPPLRDRREEIPLLALEFARELSEELGERVAKISPAALELLARHDWPGNVRELRNTIERAVVLGECHTIEVRHLPDRLQQLSQPDSVRESARGAADSRPRLELPREVVVAALDRHGGNQTHAARDLGISRFALIRLLDKFDLRGKGPG